MKKQSKIPSGIAKLPYGQIPTKVTTLSKTHSCYLLSFKHYNEDVCEIKFLEKNRSKECIQALKRITHAELGKLKEKNIDQIPIAKAGEYKKLYNHLTMDVELFEHKVQGDSRIFYFTAAEECFIVAITNNHIETDKVRR